MFSVSSLTLLLSLVLCTLSDLSHAQPVGAADSSTSPSSLASSSAGKSGAATAPLWQPPSQLWSSTGNRTFKALPPMSNPNRPILHTDPGFDASPPHPGRSPGSPGGEHSGQKNRTDVPWSRNRTVPAITHVDKESGMFYDENGQVRIFRGMAISVKVAPFEPNIETFHPVNSFADDDLRLFDKMNMNIIRLGISWAAVQPQRGPDGFDLAYLDKLVAFTERAARAGLYVLIECHQDLFAEKFMGDGAPSWAITRDWSTLPFPMPIHGFSMASYDPMGHIDAAPTNMNYSDFWGFEYGSDAVTRAFWGLYTNYDGVQDEFIRFWGKLAETFNGMSNVIGYELLNEPFIAARSTLHVPLSWLTRSNTETYYLAPMYDRIEKEIRKHDERSLLFWEPVCGSGGGLGDGFSRTPGDKPEKSVFSFHSYGPNVIDTLTLEQAISKGVWQAKRLGGGSMLTEWDVEYVQGPRRLRRVLELADANRLSWIGWQYKQFVRVAGSPPHGTLIDPHTGVYRPGMCRLFSRPYPSAVSGDLLGFNFNWNTSELTVSVAPPQGDVGGGKVTAIDPEIVVSVTEEEEWGWDGGWHVRSVTDVMGERVGTVRVEREADLEQGAQTGVRWWLERGWVEGSKLVKIRLGTDWQGRADVVVGMRDREDGTVRNWEIENEHGSWNATAETGWKWRT